MSLYQLEREENVDDLLGVLRTGDDPAIRARAAEIIGGLDLESGDRDRVVGPVARPDGLPTGNTWPCRSSLRCRIPVSGEIELSTQ